MLETKKIITMMQRLLEIGDGVNGDWRMMDGWMDGLTAWARGARGTGR